jgi:Ni,Fe-hydrogenase III large subunit
MQAVKVRRFQGVFRLVNSQIIGLTRMTKILIEQSHRMFRMRSIIKEFERLQSCILLDVTP